MANIQDLLNRQEELESVINQQGDEAPPEAGPSLVSTLLKGLSIGPNLWATAGLGLASDFNTVFTDKAAAPGFEADKSLGERFKASQDRNLGWADITEYVAPEVDLLPSNAITESKFIKPKGLLENAINYSPVRALTGKVDLGPEDGFSLKQAEEGYEKVARTVFGFVADVVTDPLMAISWTGKAAKGAKATMAASKFLSESGSEAFTKFANKVGIDEIATYMKDPELASSFKAMAEGKSLSSVSENAFNILEKSRNPLKNVAVSNANMDAITDAIMKGDNAADDVFKVARVANEQRTKLERLAKAAKETFHDPAHVVEKEKLVRQALDLGGEVSTKDLFSKEALRFAGHEIPGSAEALEYMNGKFYTADFKASQLASKLVAKGRESELPFVKKFVEGYDSLRSFPKNALSSVSRRIMSTGELFGSKSAITLMKENQRAQVFNDIDAVQKAENLFAGFSSDEAKLAYDTFEETSKRLAVMRQKFPDLPFAEVNAQVTKELGEKSSTSQTLHSFLAGEYDRMAEIEKSLGILPDTVEDYANRRYIKVAGQPDKRISLGGKEVNRGIQAPSDSFTMKRHFKLIDDAVADGYEPIKDLKVLYANRVGSHNAMVSAKKFMDNLHIQFGLSPEARDIVTKYAKTEVEAGAKSTPEIIGRARAIADRLGVEVDQEALRDVIGQSPRNVVQGPVLASVDHVFRNVDPIWGLPRELDGSVISPAMYDMKKKIFERASAPADFATGKTGDYLEKAILNEQGEIIKPGGLDKIKAVIEKNQFTWTPEERQTYAELYNNYKKSTTKLSALGREGEFLRDRAGTDRLPEHMQKFIGKALTGVDEVSKTFYQGDLPTPIVNMVNDAYDTRSWYQRMSKHPDAVGTPYEKVFSKTADGYTNMLSLLRAGSTRIWPSYIIGNLGQAQFQGVQALPAYTLLAEQLAPHKLWENRKIFEKNADMITDFGERISNRQIMREMQQHGIKVSYQDASELSGYWAKAFDILGGHVDPRTLEKVNKEPNKAIKGFKDFSEGIENYGRSNLYVALRKKGVSAQSAAEKTAQTMIDYQFGKTNLEKSALSNLFFFYAFARGSATNTAVSLFTNPGALALQGDYVRLMTNLMKDEGAIQPDNFSKDVSSLKTTEGLAAYLGEDLETGNPKIISSFRTPFEETSRMIPLRLPTGLSANELGDSLKQNIKGITRAQLSAMNPLIKGNIELATGRNLYFDKPLNDPYLNQVVKPSAVLDALAGSPQKDPTRFDPTGITKFANMYLPPISMANSKAKQLAKSKDPLTGLLGVLTGLRSNVVDPEISGSYDRVGRLKEYILSNYGVDVGNKKVSTLLEDIGYSKEGLNPKRVRREQKEEAAIQKEQRKVEKEYEHRLNVLNRSLDKANRQIEKAQEQDGIKAERVAREKAREVKAEIQATKRQEKEEQRQLALKEKEIAERKRKIANAFK